MSVNKHINVNDGSGRSFEDLTVGEIVLDTKPELGSFNGVTSDAVARAVAGASGEVPQVTEDDNGKVLKAVYDEGGPGVEWGEAASVDQSYDPTSENAQSGTAVAEAVSGVNAPPVPSVSDEGKVLSVAVYGETASMEWTEPATVDQTYDASSTNAQSGVAVAEAVGGVLPSITGQAGKVLAVNSGATGLEWVSGGGDSDQPLPAVGTNVLRFEFEDMSFDPTNDAGCNFTGTSWAKVAEATTRNIWDCTLASSPASGSSGHFMITTPCHVIDGIYGRPLANLFSGVTLPYEPYYASTGLRSVNLTLFGNAIYNQSASYAFAGCQKLEKVRLSSVGGACFTEAKGMFHACSLLEEVLCLSSSSGTVTPSMSYVEVRGSSVESMFNGCHRLRTVQGFAISSATTGLKANNMFNQCYNLESTGLMFACVGVSFNVTNASHMFDRCTRLKEIGSALKFSATSLAALFSDCWSLERVALLDLNGTVTSMESAFKNCYALAEVNIINSGSVTNWNSTFSIENQNNGVARLKLPELDTSGATSVAGMFKNNIYADGALAMYQQLSQQANPPTTTTGCFTDCGSITHASDLAQIPASWGGTGADPLPSHAIRCKFTSGYTPTQGDSQTLVDAGENIWDISKSGNDWSTLFDQCTDLLEVIDANTTGVTSMYCMFSFCASLAAVPLLDTSNVTDMGYMFYNCTNVESGALALYQQASGQATPPSSYSGCFTNCGSGTTTGAAELAQIPSGWGGTGS